MLKSKQQLKNKLYLSKLSIGNYCEYYNNLLNDIVIIFHDSAINLRFDFKTLYVDNQYLENTKIVRISLDLVNALEEYFKEIDVYGTKNEEKHKSGNFLGGDIDTKIENDDNQEEAKKFWKNKIEQAANTLCENGKYSQVPLSAKMKYASSKSKNIDWRKELYEYILHDVADYTLTPPDRRFQESEFYLPAYNEVDEDMKNILFMFDTSASMKKEVINDVVAEVKNIVYQFRGNMRGFVGNFDTKVYDVKTFDDPSELKEDNFKGGGGTNFVSIFDFVNSKMQEYDLKAIIILTDGYGEFPKEWEIGDIPVVWVMTGSVSPYFGKVIKYK